MDDQISPRALYIGGRWVETETMQPIRNPYNEDVVANVYVGGEPEMEAAIAAAYAALEPLAALTNAERGDALDHVSRRLDETAAEIALTLSRESGKPIRDAKTEVSRAAHTFQIAAEEARRFGAGETIPFDRVATAANRYGITRRFPIGVVGAITPFNFPLNLVAHKVAPALAAANPVVLKPAHQTPLTALNLAAIIAETSLPPGSVNVVHTPPALGERLATDERVAVLSFTGSGRVGWMLKEKASRKKVILELGGNAAAIVHSDADLAFTAKRLAIAAFAYAGQVCISAQRLYVQAAIYDEFIDRLLQETKSLKVGDPQDEAIDVGPMISADAARRAEGLVREAVEGGATLLLGDGVAKGTMLGLVVLAGVRPEMAVSREEAFAPIVTVGRYHDFDEALGSVNDSDFGLQASVFTNDIRLLNRAFEKLEVGAVIHNEAPNFRVDHMPYGGVKGSGFGREGVRYAIEEMSELRLLAVNPM